MLDCPDLAVPREVMQHVVHVESSRNPFAIGVVGGYLARQPKNLEEALATVRQLKEEGYNFSVGISQVNRYNLAKYGLKTYEQAFEVCPNLQAGSRILRECYDRAQDWGKAFSCYYSGNFATGFQHGYVQKVFASMRKASSESATAGPIRIISNRPRLRETLPPDAVPVTNQEGLGAAQSGAALRAEAGGASGMSTAESRPAILVPGPGAVVSQASREPLDRNKVDIGQIPTQLVGVNGNPHQTKQLPARQPPPAVPGNALPLPDPFLTPELSRDTALAAPSRGGVSRVTLLRKGGPIVHGEAPGSVARPAASSSLSPPSGGVGKTPGESADQSFVF
jgi:type IV secretion system protein VirB1